MSPGQCDTARWGCCRAAVRAASAPSHDGLLALGNILIEGQSLLQRRLAIAHQFAPSDGPTRVCPCNDQPREQDKRQRIETGGSKRPRRWVKTIMLGWVKRTCLAPFRIPSVEHPRTVPSSSPLDFDHTGGLQAAQRPCAGSGSEPNGAQALAGQRDRITSASFKDQPIEFNQYPPRRAGNVEGKAFVVRDAGKSFRCPHPTLWRREFSAVGPNRRTRRPGLVQPSAILFAVS
jgi:hypothetical protein